MLQMAMKVSNPIYPSNAPVKRALTKKSGVSLIMTLVIALAAMIMGTALVTFLQEDTLSLASSSGDICFFSIRISSIFPLTCCAIGWSNLFLRGIGLTHSL